MDKLHSDIEISAVFPPKLEYSLRDIFDCRIKLYSNEGLTLNSGEMKQVPTNVFINPNNGWILSTKGNPELRLHFQEQFIRNINCRQQIYITIMNLSETKQILPIGTHIGFLILM